MQHHRDGLCVKLAVDSHVATSISVFSVQDGMDPKPDLTRLRLEQSPEPFCHRLTGIEKAETGFRLVVATLAALAALAAQKNSDGRVVGEV